MSMKIETPLIALLLGGIIFTGLFSIFMGLGGEYDVDTDLSGHTSQNGELTFQESFDRVEETKSEMEDVVSDFEDTTLTDTGSVFPFLSLVLKTGKQMFSSITIVKDVVFIAADVIGIEPAIVGILITILIITILISILMLLLGRSY